MSSGKLVLGALAGLAAGALLGILFAPEKGKVTRKKIVDKSEDYLGEVKVKFNVLIDELNRKMDLTKAKADEMVEKVNTKVEEVKASAK